MKAATSVQGSMIQITCTGSCPLVSVRLLLLVVYKQNPELTARTALRCTKLAKTTAIVQHATTWL